MGKRKVFSVWAMGGYADATACTRNFSCPLPARGASTPILSWVLPLRTIGGTTRTLPSCANSWPELRCPGTAAPPWRRASRPPHSIASMVQLLDCAALRLHPPRCSPPRPQTHANAHRPGDQPPRNPSPHITSHHNHSLIHKSERALAHSQ
jgi:hypothetical protein